VTDEPKIEEVPTQSIPKQQEPTPTPVLNPNLQAAA
jgi:hypothetical protein